MTAKTATKQAQRKAVDLIHDLAFQVRAINCHDDLLAALRWILTTTDGSVRPSDRAIADVARAAIAEAEA